MAGGTTFRFFVSLILFLWFASLLGELNAIIQLADFAYNFPEASGGDPFKVRQIMDSVSRRVETLTRRIGRIGSPKEGDEDMPVVDVDMIETKTCSFKDPKVITGISHVHRCLCVIMVLTRALLLFYMAMAGVAFLITTYSYTDLLMNAVALAFVFELPEFLFLVLVGRNQKEELEEVEPLVYRTSLPEDKGVRGMVQSNNFWGLVLIPILIFLIVKWDARVNINLMTEALHCACLGEGPKCFVSPKLTQTWWDNYWSNLASHM